MSHGNVTLSRYGARPREFLTDSHYEKATFQKQHSAMLQIPGQSCHVYP